MTPDELAARASIRVAIETYTSAGDRGALDELTSAFTADGRLELFGRVCIGRAAIADALGRVVDPRCTGPDRRPLGFLRHHLTSSKVDLDDDGRSARGWTYFLVLTPIGLDHGGVYVDRFVPDGDRWAIAERRIKVDWADPRSLVLASQVTGGWLPWGWATPSTTPATSVRRSAS
ncbi:MAG: nuclear transport factor 2 family protein [Actinomycetota bacterium]|nr:nuclear transport factor 2 family protein [Actinomycetota bacterium]